MMSPLVSDGEPSIHNSAVVIEHVSATAGEIQPDTT